MTEIKRFGVSLNKEVLNNFDRLILKTGYSTRSKAIEDLIRDALVKHEWEKGKNVAGIISVIYDHHKRGVVSAMIDIEHEFPNMIISSLHIHLDHDNCLEIIVTKGSTKNIRKLKNAVKTIKGVKHCSLSITSTGEEI